MMRRRLVLLASPRESTILDIDDPRRWDRYKHLQVIQVVKVPDRLPESVGRAGLDELRGRLAWS